MSYKDENELILKTIQWVIECAAEISNAGGIPSLILRDMSDNTKITMVRNNLVIKYKGKSNG